MKQTKLKEVAEIITHLQSLASRIDSIKNDEETFFDEHGEAWQEGEVGEECAQNIEYLEAAVDTIEEVISHLENIN